MPMTALRVHDTETDLPRLLKQVAAGDEVVILHDNQPVARIVREVPPMKKTPLLGAMRGRLGPCDDADLPLPDEYLGLDIFDDKPL